MAPNLIEMTHEDLLLNWEFLWDLKEKIFLNVKKMEEDILKLEIIEEKFKKDLSSTQDIGQLVGEIIKKINPNRYILKALTGTRYIVSVQNAVDKKNLKQNPRVALDSSTLTIMKILGNRGPPAATSYHYRII